MKPIKFTQVNIKLVAENCDDLHAYKDNSKFITCWEISDDELMTILQTKRIWLHVVGKEHPPVRLDVSQPFDIIGDHYGM